MALTALDHVNVRTANLDQMINWYRDVLGMEAGDRPAFSFPGAWLYLNGHPAVHLVGVATAAAGQDPKLEHFAFSASGLTSFLDTLKRQNVTYHIIRVPGFGVLQVNLSDFDGNHIHVDFRGTEAETYRE